MPDVVARLRSRGARIAYSDALLSYRMLVRRDPSSATLATGDPAALLRELVASYGLAVEVAADETLSIVPGPELDATALRRMARANAPLLQRLDSFEALPPRVESPSPDGRFVELDLSRSAPPPQQLGAETERVLVQVSNAPSGDAAALRYQLKERIVELEALAPRARFGLELLGPARALAGQIVDSRLAPYIDGYVAEERSELPSADPTGSLWWRAPSARSHQGPLLETLLEGAARGADLVIVGQEERTPSAARYDRSDDAPFLEALQASGAVSLQAQPPITASTSGIWTHLFLEPRNAHYVLAAMTPGGLPASLTLVLEPMTQVRALYPPGAAIDASSSDSEVTLRFDGSSPNWLIELVPEALLARAGDTRVEDAVIVDPYEVVVLNQIFQQRERSKVESLDVRETLTILPTEGGVRSDWEHRIFHRRDHPDEFLHLGVSFNGAPVPQNKLHRVELWRPIERIELSPLLLENKKTYRYRYLGEEEIDGHPTWRIAFEPVFDGRLVRGTAWIDQHTGAHRRIRTEHGNLGRGVLSGELTTDYGWIADQGECYWDWRLRTGSEVADFLELSGTYAVEYRRRHFQFNRSDIEQRIQEAHDSDVLIHVATPPEGHRWLLRGQKLRARRGDQPYPAAGCPDADCRRPPSPSGRSRRVASSSGSAADTADPVGDVLAGLYAFPSSSRFTLGVVTGGRNVESTLRTRIDYLNHDFLGRGRRSDDVLYLRLAAFNEAARLEVIDPAIGQTPWSWTASLDVDLDPEADDLFRASGTYPTNRDVSLDVSRSTFGLSLSRPLGHDLVGSLQYGLHHLSVERLAATDPSFVLPPSTLEHSLGLKLEWSWHPMALALQAEGASRDQWDRWGLAATELARDRYGLVQARLSTVHSLGQSQSVSASLAFFEGWQMDRFSRPRLDQVDAHVDGYDGALAFDSAVHLALTYNFRIGRVPFRAILRGAHLGYLRQSGRLPEPDQTLLGARLGISLHGPLETDWRIGLSRGLHAEPERSSPTYWWVFVSRRFGA